MQRSIALIAAVLVNCVAGQKQWYFRGTPNGWAGNEILPRPNDGRFCHTEQFAKNGDGFKISSSVTDWNEAFPSSNWVIHEGPGVYDICFAESTKQIQVTKLSNFVGPYLRSTKNNWEAVSPMTLSVSRYGRSEYIRIEDFAAGAEFKVGETASWNDPSYPENNYVINEEGRYKITYRNFVTGTLGRVSVKKLS